MLNDDETIDDETIDDGYDCDRFCFSN